MILSWAPLATLATGLLSIPLQWVSAQHSNVTCPPEYNWMNNSKGQSPCLIAAYVQSVCNYGSWTVDPLANYTHYIVTNANPCQCSSVTYSLMAACSICQGRYYIAYPENIPSWTPVPHWAYQNVTTSDFFNATVAQVVGGIPESTATQVTITAITSTTPTSSITGGAVSQFPTSSPSSSSKSNIGAIVGGAIGGIGLVANAAFITWFCIRHRRQTKPLSARYGGTNSMYTAMKPFTPSATQPVPYDLSDPNTFFTSAPLMAIHTSPYTRHQNNPTKAYIAQSQRPVTYSALLFRVLILYIHLPSKGPRMHDTPARKAGHYTYTFDTKIGGWVVYPKKYRKYYPECKQQTCGPVWVVDTEMF
ncbi:hypothetical protein J3A83DRAFT_4186046 [Scleroderma citrinum]